jgi:hypothetical protein
MNDPLPLIEEGVTQFESELLHAGRRDAMSARSRQRIMTGLGIGGGIIAATTIASGVKATTAKGVLSTIGFGAAVGAVGAIAIWVGVAARSPNHPPAPPKAAPAQPAARPVPAPVPQPEPTVVEEPVTALPDVKPAQKATPVRGATPASDSLALELSAIEDARNALARRDYSLSLRLLDDYSRRFSKRHLDSEAMVLRIEALAAKGDRESATRLGKSFLTHHPNGPYARRVRSLVGDL